MTQEHISYYSLTIHPSQINVYYDHNGPCGRRLNAPEDAGPIKSPGHDQPTQFKDNYHHGRMSPVARRKMSKSADYLLYLAKPKTARNSYHGGNFSFKVNFTTLTLSSPQVHSDQEIKEQLLHHFFVEMKRLWGIDKYVWRAEKQKNGSIHFHILADKFIPWNELRNVWNRIQQKLGYVTRYRADRMEWHRDGFRYDPKLGKHWHYKDQLKAYKSGKQTGWDNPNSTDIHSLRYVSNIKTYITKYMSKNEEFTDEQKRMFNALPREEQDKIRQEKFVSGRLWGSSANLVNLSGGNAVVCSEIERELERVYKNDRQAVYNSDYFHVYTVDIATLNKLDCPCLISIFEDYIRKRFPDKYLPLAS